MSFPGTPSPCCMGLPPEDLVAVPTPTPPAESERAPDLSLPVPPPFICSPLGLVGAQQVLLCGPAQEGPLLTSSLLCPNCSGPRFSHGPCQGSPPSRLFSPFSLCDVILPSRAHRSLSFLPNSDLCLLPPMMMWTFLEPDILVLEVKWALGSITTN